MLNMSSSCPTAHINPIVHPMAETTATMDSNFLNVGRYKHKILNIPSSTNCMFIYNSFRSKIFLKLPNSFFITLYISKCLMLFLLCMNAKIIPKKKVLDKMGLGGWGGWGEAIHWEVHLKLTLREGSGLTPPQTHTHTREEWYSRLVGEGGDQCKSKWR